MLRTIVDKYPEQSLKMLRTNINQLRTIPDECQEQPLMNAYNKYECKEQQLLTNAESNH